MIIILKYRGKYQVTYQWCQNYDDNGNLGEYEFTENENDIFIILKKDGCIYRRDNKILVLNLKYTTHIGSDATLIKEPLKSLHKEIEDAIKIIDTYYFDDCIEVVFYEKELDKLMEVLGDKFGCYKGRIRRSPKSIKNLPDYEDRRKRVEVITHEDLHKKLSEAAQDKAESMGKPIVVVWNKLYSAFKDSEGVDIKELADEQGIKPIYIIDSKNYYGKLIELLSQIR